MQLSQKPKKFSQLFFAFSKFNLSFKHFQKKDDPHSWCFPEITESKNVVRYMSKKSRFRKPIDRQHVKRAQTLLQSERQFR